MHAGFLWCFSSEGVVSKNEPEFAGIVDNMLALERGHTHKSIGLGQQVNEQVQQLIFAVKI